MHFITIKGPDSDIVELKLDESQRYTLGRAPSNAIVLNDPKLSRLHAELFFEGERWSIRDCDSANGTSVNGMKIRSPHPLTSKDWASVGNTQIKLRNIEAKTQVRFADRPLAATGTLMVSAKEILEEATRQDLGDSLHANEELKAMRRRFQALEKANMELLGHESTDVLFSRILEIVSEAVGSDRAALLQQEDGEIVCKAFHGEDAADLSVSRTIARKVLDEGVGVMTADAQSDTRFESSLSVMRQGIRSVMAVPLWNNKEVIGLIYTDSLMKSRHFSDEDLKLLVMLANVAAIQIENRALYEANLDRERMEREAHAAGKIQMGLLPTEAPEIPGYQAIGENSQCYAVGGDYYDFLRLDDKRFGIVLGDVSGKGMDAALLMAVLQATIRARAEHGPTAEELTEKLNDAIDRSSPDSRFVTLVWLDLDTSTGKARCVNAGHMPCPIIVRSSGEIEEIESGGMPIGMLPGLTYKVTELELAPGDLFFACSDGITEALNGAGEMFGDDELKALLKSLSGQSVEDVRNKVMSTLFNFCGDAPRTDDVTLVALQREF